MKSRYSLTPYLLPSIADFIFFFLFLSLSMTQGKKLLNDGDTGYHVTIGEYILDHLTVPTVDVFRFISPPIPWTPHEWLSELIMALIHRWSGISGIVVFFSFLLALTYYVYFRILRVSSHDILLAVFFSVLVATTSNLHWLARPHVLTLLIFTVWYGLLRHMQKGGDIQWYWFPLLMLFWVNLHGGYIAGFLLLGTYLCGNIWDAFTFSEDNRIKAINRIKRIAGVFFLCLITTMFNPVGYKVLLIPFKLVADGYMTNNVAEYLSPNFHEPMIFKYVLLGMLLILLLSINKTDKVDVITLLFFTNMALYSVRHIPLFALIAAPVMLSHAESLLAGAPASFKAFLLRRTENITRVDSGTRGCLWVLLPFIIVMSLLFTGKIKWNFDDTKKPLAAVEFIKNNHISGNMFNDDEFGDFVIYLAHKEYKVFYDGRMDMDGPNILKEYNKVTNLEPGWEDVFKKYNISWVFYGANSRLTSALRQSSKWKLIYSDKVANILVRNIPEYKHLIDRFEILMIANR